MANCRPQSNTPPFGPIRTHFEHAQNNITYVGTTAHNSLTCWLYSLADRQTLRNASYYERKKKCDCCVVLTTACNHAFECVCVRVHDRRLSSAKGTIPKQHQNKHWLHQRLNVSVCVHVIYALCVCWIIQLPNATHTQHTHARHRTRARIRERIASSTHDNVVRGTQSKAYTKNQLVCEAKKPAITSNTCVNTHTRTLIHSQACTVHPNTTVCACALCCH